MESGVAVVGDFDQGNTTHHATNAALDGLGLPFAWVPTDAPGLRDGSVLGGSSGVWIAPASPYRDIDGALSAIRFARERSVPLVGT